MVDLQQLLDEGDCLDDVGQGAFVSFFFDDLVQLSHCCVGLFVVLCPEVALGKHQTQLAVGLILC